ncbi:MAG: hypothetical protein MO846_09825 [Candidatus Devosia symbiotica]|nr:hypothetical protein [Candidatus Devosia symbiotica]
MTPSGKTGELTDSDAVFWTYSAAANATNDTVTIKDSNGQVAYTETGPLSSGSGTSRWGDIGGDDNAKPNGVYSIKIKGSDATDGPSTSAWSRLGLLQPSISSAAYRFLAWEAAGSLLSR